MLIEEYEIASTVLFIKKERVIEQYLYCKEILGTTRSEIVLNDYMMSVNLPSGNGVDICTNVAASMTCKMNGFVVLSKQQNSEIVWSFLNTLWGFILKTIN